MLGAAMIKQYNIGLLFSQDGSYAPLGRAMLAGARLAVDEVNADPQRAFRLEPVAHDPGGDLSRYYDAVKDMLTGGDIKHVVGCYTSSSRKEVLPLFEKHDGLLWYPSHYEGFESSDNVIYTGAAPNQHIMPLLRYLTRTKGNRAWCVGSNYIWAWENNRILREAITGIGGEVIFERYCPIGETDLLDIARQIVADRPDFVYCTLIGESLYRFLDLFREVAQAAGIDQARDIPVASCSLSEAELPAIKSARSGHLSASVYFSTIATAENEKFSRTWRKQFGHLGLPCADAEASYLAVHFLARALDRAGSADTPSVRNAARGLAFDAPQGKVTLDPQNLHCSMRPRIGVSRDDGSFSIICEEAQSVRPDPYLVWSEELTAQGASKQPNLRVVK